MTYTLDAAVTAAELIPLGDRILVETQPPEQELKVGSLYVPQQAQDAPLWGTVKAIGPDFQVSAEVAIAGDERWIVRVGDRVLHARYGGHEVKLPNGAMYLFLRPEDCIAKIGGAHAG